MENKKLKGLKNYKDLLGIFYYVTSRFLKGDVKQLIKLLEKAVNNEPLGMEVPCPNGILYQAIREEVLTQLESTESEDYVNMNTDDFDELVEDVTYNIVFNNDGIWEELNKDISWYANKYMGERD